MEIQFSVKKFYSKDMFKDSKKILTESESSAMNYNIDSLIFTPTSYVSGDENNQHDVKDEKVTGVTWDLCYRQTRGQYHDFLVKTNDEIKYNTKGAYKTLHLLW